MITGTFESWCLFSDTPLSYAVRYRRLSVNWRLDDRYLFMNFHQLPSRLTRDCLLISASFLPKIWEGVWTIALVPMTTSKAITMSFIPERRLLGQILDTNIQLKWQFDGFYTSLNCWPGYDSLLLSPRIFKVENIAECVWLFVIYSSIMLQNVLQYLESSMFSNKTTLFGVNNPLFLDKFDGAKKTTLIFSRVLTAWSAWFARF